MPRLQGLDSTGHPVIFSEEGDNRTSPDLLEDGVLTLSPEDGMITADGNMECISHSLDLRWNGLLPKRLMILEGWRWKSSSSRRRG